ncbi:MAG: hypothetical protein KTR31_09000 [Myxococcales bacterium]|nr:hypothetical protein [Myxococcales bacterium]
MRLGTDLLDELGTPPVQHRARQRLSVIAVVYAVAFTLLSMSGLAWFAWGGVASVRSLGADVDLISAGLWGVLALVCRIRHIRDARVWMWAQGVYVASSATLSGFSALGAYQLGSDVSVLTWAPVVVATYPLIVPSTPAATARTAWAAMLAAVGAVALAGWGTGAGSVADVLASVPALAVAAVVAVVGADQIHRTTVDVRALQEHRALLTAVLSNTADALVLRDPDGAVLLANDEARRLLGSELTEGPAALRRALEAAREGLVVDPQASGAPSFLVVRRPVEIGLQPHELWVVREVTQAVDTASMDAWRTLLRTLSHELNNSLGPMASTLRSVRRMLADPTHADRLTTAMDALDARVEHLTRFLGDYGRLARLPPPRPEPVHWASFLARLQQVEPFVLRDVAPGKGRFDPAQIEQVLLNVLRNAREAGSPEPEVAVGRREDGWELVVADRGEGFSAEASANALVPFFTTRSGGSGLGLALSRDIVAGHGGTLQLQAREGGGAVVRIWLRGEDDAG